MYGPDHVVWNEFFLAWNSVQLYCKWLEAQTHGNPLHWGSLGDLNGMQRFLSSCPHLDDRLLYLACSGLSWEMEAVPSGEMAAQDDYDYVTPT